MPRNATKRRQDNEDTDFFSSCSVLCTKLSVNMEDKNAMVQFGAFTMDCTVDRNRMACSSTVIQHNSVFFSSVIEWTHARTDDVKFRVQT